MVCNPWTGSASREQLRDRISLLGKPMRSIIELMIDRTDSLGWDCLVMTAW